MQPNFPECLPLDPVLSAGGGCVHIAALGCKGGDLGLVKALLTDIDKLGERVTKHRSGRHLQAFGDRLTASPTFTAIVARLLTIFDLSMVDCWINVYRDGGESKSWHFDNYQDRSPEPTVTIGLSLGGSRDLAFEYAPRGVPTGQQFFVHQKNGDVFAFDETFNRNFRHAIPAARSPEKTGLRVSVIIWAMEGQGLAVPSMVRGGPGMRPAQEIDWRKWDLEAGIWCDSEAFG